MYHFMNAHPLTLMIVVAAVMVTPFYILATYVFSGASMRRGFCIGGAFLVWGAFMSWVCLAEVPKSLGTPGALVVPVCWALPTLLLLIRPAWFLSQPLSQRWLIALQLWRAIGGVFLIEMGRGHIPGIFAYPAGLGDLAVAFLAATVLMIYRHRPRLPKGAVLAVALIGITDFLSAFFFGFTSTEGPGQLFFPEIANDTLRFPTGMIPLFLVPYAIFFHVLSLIQLRNESA